MGTADRWLEQAFDDLDDAAYVLADDREETAAFLLQQAAEKALKALQIAEDGDYQRTHNLVELGGGLVPDRFRTVLADLNPVYTGFQYPDAEAGVANTGDLYDDVEALLAWIQTRLDG